VFTRVILILVHVFDVWRLELWVFLVVYVDHVAVHPRTNRFCLSKHDFHRSIWVVAKSAVCELKRASRRRVIFYCTCTMEVLYLPVHIVWAAAQVKSNFESFALHYMSFVSKYRPIAMGDTSMMSMLIA